MLNMNLRTIKAGDANNSGGVDINDAILVLKQIVSLENIKANYGAKALAQARVNGTENCP